MVIVGAGPIGLLTLLAVRRRGAGSVTITDRSATVSAVARSLGADLAIDVRARPIRWRRSDRMTGGRGADVVFEAVGISATVAQSLAVARTGGHVTWIGNSAPIVELPMQDMVTRELTLRGSYTFADEFEDAIELMAIRPDRRSAPDRADRTARRCAGHLPPAWAREPWTRSRSCSSRPPR